MNLFIIRHGESLGNRTGKIQGWMDFSLSELGEKQAEALAQYFKDIQLDYIYSSDLTRAFETAQAIALKKEMTVRPWDRVREVHLGPFQGLSRQEIYEKFPEAKANSILTSGVANTESVAELTERCRKVIEHLQASHSNDAIAIVSHGGFISIFLMYILTGESWHHFRRPFQIGNTSITHIEWKTGKMPLIHYVNQTKHLDQLTEENTATGLL